MTGKLSWEIGSVTCMCDIYNIVNNFQWKKSGDIKAILSVLKIDSWHTPVYDNSILLCIINWKLHEYKLNDHTFLFYTYVQLVEILNPYWFPVHPSKCMFMDNAVEI